jgi:D-alanyl-D-alanine carboxypeptidase/D-alanyl-D-alanine-endopeptidase (penicillin-binding protein 4)
VVIVGLGERETDEDCDENRGHRPKLAVRNRPMEATGPKLSPMQRWILPLLLLVVAAFAAWQAVETDSALAEEVVAVGGKTAPPLSTPLLSVRRTPEFLREPILIENLQISLDAVVEDFPSQSCLVVTLDGEEVYSENPTLPLVPASAQKLLTAYGVYEVLGAEYTYETAVVTDAVLVDGVLDGDLYLIGGGDPLLATAPYTDRYEQQPHFRTPLEQLADSVVAAGILEINGGVIGDETRYDTERYVPEWPERFTDAAQNQTGPLSALTVNDGFSRFDPNPANSLATASSDPAAFAAAAFDDLLEERGVIIRSSAVAAEAPAGGRTIASITSDPVTVVTNQMLDISDNMGAELLMKEIGVATSARGTTDDGAIGVENVLRSAGFSVSETDVVDGSGLASENRVSCRLLVEVLEDSADSPLHEGLAVAGESGTLRERLVGTAAEGRVRAKTGRLNEVGALAGTALGNDDSVLTFAWIGNTTGEYPLEEMIETQDAIALELVAYPEGPDPDALGPTG